MKLIQMLQERKEFTVMEDGFVYWWPTTDSVRMSDGTMTGGGGALSAIELRIIADELDRRNAAWQAQIDRDQFR